MRMHRYRENEHPLPPWYVEPLPKIPMEVAVTIVAIKVACSSQLVASKVGS